MPDTRRRTVDIRRNGMEMESLAKVRGGHEVGITSSRRQILGCG